MVGRGIPGDIERRFAEASAYPDRELAPSPEIIERATRIDRIAAARSLRGLAWPKKRRFDSPLTEPGPPALLTPDGIVLIYNGANSPVDGAPETPAFVYQPGQLLMDDSDPKNIIGRLRHPFLRIDEAESEGQVGDVCFAQACCVSRSMVALSRTSRFAHRGCDGRLKGSDLIPHALGKKRVELLIEWSFFVMEMHQVRYFLAMARSLNFTRAAEECNVTQPSLTRAIQKLEEEFGGSLFRRERSRTHLTDLGRLMLPHLERTYDAAQAAKMLARDIGKAQIAPLALGIANTIENDMLDAVLAEIGAGLPGFELSIQTGTSEEMIELGLSGALDLIIVEVPEDAPDRLETWPLFEHVYHMVTRAGHPLASGESITLDDIREEFWIEYCQEGAKALRDAAREAGFEPHFRHRADSPVQLRRLVLAGLGSAFMPPPRDRAQLAALRFTDIQASRGVVLAAIGGRRRSLAADTFVRASRARTWDLH